MAPKFRYCSVAGSWGTLEVSELPRKFSHLRNEFPVFKLLTTNSYPETASRANLLVHWHVRERGEGCEQSRWDCARNPTAGQIKVSASVRQTPRELLVFKLKLIERSNFKFKLNLLQRCEVDKIRREGAEAEVVPAQIQISGSERHDGYPRTTRLKHTQYNDASA